MLCPSPDGDWTKDQCYDSSRYTWLPDRLVINEYVCGGNTSVTRHAAQESAAHLERTARMALAFSQDVSCTEDSDCLEGEVCTTDAGTQGPAVRHTEPIAIELTLRQGRASAVLGVL